MVRKQPKLPKNTSSDHVYQPTSPVITHLTEILDFEKLKKNKKYVGDRLSNSEIKKRDLINKNKNTLLNIVFRSMANLVYFLEFVANHNMLAPEFEMQLKELTGILNKNVNNQKREQDKGINPLFRTSFVFGRLIDSLLSLTPFPSEWLENSNPKKRIIKREIKKIQTPEQELTGEVIISNFRLLLIESLHDKILKVTTNLATMQFPDNDGMRQLIMQDMYRANSWIKFFSQRAYYELKPKIDELDSDNHKVHRLVNF